MKKVIAQPIIHSDLGETAVEGLFSGLAAGVVMLVFLLASGLLAGEAPGLILSRFSIQTPANPIQGAFVHLAVSATYGMIFGMIWSLAGRRFSSWTVALLFVLAIYLLARFVLLPANGSPLQEIAPLPFALAHLVYGLVLGLWFREK